MTIDTSDLLNSILGSLSRIDYIKPEEVPNIPLYMDQVTTFMDAQLASSKRYPEDKILTKTMINNYAKNDLLPPPLKKKYSKPVSKPKKGIYCEVHFFETHRCTELFFLYYYRYTARAYNNQQELLLALNKQCGYEKTLDFFKKSQGLHAYLEKKGGKLDTAIHNAKHSMDEKLADNRNYTYSELGRMIEELKNLL